MEQLHHPTSQPSEYGDMLEAKRKELLGNLASGEYAGYEELYHGDIKQLIEKLRADGINVLNL
jgi:hypothetical protein